MVAPVGFWSYVHADDEADHGRIVQLAHDIVAEMMLLTGDDIELFLDRDAIKWGQQWQAVIGAGLGGVAFFIPVLTPRYFTRPECRNEMETFARKADQLGVRQLIMPLLYVDFNAIHDDPPSDNLMALAKSFQWEPWMELRLTDRDSALYRQGISRLATRLADANASAEEAPPVGLNGTSDSALADSTDEAPGILDQINDAEAAMPNWAESMTGIGTTVASMGELFTHATADLAAGDARGAGTAGRLFVARELAGSLAEPVNEVYDLASESTRHLHTIDIGVRALLEGLIAESSDGTEDRTEICQFFETMRGFDLSLREGLDAVRDMADAVAPMERMSRDLRRPLRKLRQGLTLLMEGQAVINVWIRLINESGVDCNGMASSG